MTTDNSSFKQEEYLKKLYSNRFDYQLPFLWIFLGGQMFIKASKSLEVVLK